MPTPKPAPGSYQERYQNKTRRYQQKDRSNDSELVWARTDIMDMAIYQNRDDMALNPGADDADNVVSEPITGTDNVSLSLRRTRGRRGTMSLALTGLTKAELDVVRRVFNEACDMAEPICEERDRIAQQAAERGDDSYYRIYRPVPLFVDRRGRKPEHGSGV